LFDYAASRAPSSRIRRSHQHGAAAFLQEASSRKIRSISHSLDAGARRAVCEVVARDPNVDMLAWAAMFAEQAGAWDGRRALRICSPDDKPVIALGRITIRCGRNRLLPRRQRLPS